MRTAKNMSCSKIIRRRRREAETRNGYIQLLARIILVIVCGGLLFTQGFFTYESAGQWNVPGNQRR